MMYNLKMYKFQLFFTDDVTVVKDVHLQKEPSPIDNSDDDTDDEIVIK